MKTLKVNSYTKAGNTIKNQIKRKIPNKKITTENLYKVF